MSCTTQARVWIWRVVTVHGDAHSCVQSEAREHIRSCFFLFFASNMWSQAVCKGLFVKIHSRLKTDRLNQVSNNQNTRDPIIMKTAALVKQINRKWKSQSQMTHIISLNVFMNLTICRNPGFDQVWTFSCMWISSSVFPLLFRQVIVMLFHMIFGANNISYRY